VATYGSESDDALCAWVPGEGMDTYADQTTLVARQYPRSRSARAFSCCVEQANARANLLRVLAPFPDSGHGQAHVWREMNESVLHSTAIARLALRSLIDDGTIRKARGRYFLAHT